MSSEFKDPGFRSRLSSIIGDEKPFAWAERVGISKGAFSRIWNDGTVPGPDHLRRIRETEGISIDWLLTGQGPKSVDSAENKMSLYRESIERLKNKLSSMEKNEIDVGCAFGMHKISYDETLAFLSGNYNPNETQLIELCRIASGEYDSPDFIDTITNIKIPYLDNKIDLDVNLLRTVIEVVEEIDSEEKILSPAQRAELMSFVYYMNQETKYNKKRIHRFIEALCILIEQGIEFNSIPELKMTNLIREVAHHVVKGDGDELGEETE